MPLMQMVIRLCQWLGTAVTALPLALATWLLLYYFILPRDRGDPGPANWPDIGGGLALIVGSVLLGWSVLLLVATVGVWRRRRTAAVGLMMLCVLQAALQSWFLARVGDWPWR